MSANDLVEFLDRQYQYLDGLTGDAYIYQVARWLSTLGQDTRLSAFFDDMRRDAKASVFALFEHREAICHRVG